MPETLSHLLHSLCADAHVSDVLLREGVSPWVRRGGRLLELDASPVTREGLSSLIDGADAHSGISAHKAEELLNRRGDIDFALALEGLRFRANLYRTNGRRWALALRRLASSPPKLENLGLPEGWTTQVNRSKGLLLVTGGTGSGKTTTLAATLEYLNQRMDGHIITLEDPVEYQLTSARCLIDQREVGQDVKDFSSGLRAALREDPDIILVGELRDRETVEIALQAANTGHLVLGTLHTMNARQTVERVSSFYPHEARDWAQVVLSQVLLGVLSQTLVPHRDPEQPQQLAAEFLMGTTDVAAAIRDGKSNQIFAAMDTGSAQGHVLLNHSLSRLVREQKVRFDDAVRASYDPVRFRKDNFHV